MAQTTAELIEQGQDPSKALTVPEKKRLKECEQIIKKGLGTFIEVGRALAEINDGRLYKETHSSFEKYCKEVWDLGKSTAHDKINSYRVVNLLEEKVSAIADTFDGGINHKGLVQNIKESQTRPLHSLKDPDDHVKVWNLILKHLNENPDTKVTAALIKKAVKEVRGEAVKKKIEHTKQEVEKTSLLSPQFQSQYQILLDIVVASKNNGFKDCSKKMVKKHLQALLDIVESED